MKSLLLWLVGEGIDLLNVVEIVVVMTQQCHTWTQIAPAQVLEPTLDLQRLMVEAAQQASCFPCPCRNHIRLILCDAMIVSDLELHIYMRLEWVLSA